MNSTLKFKKIVKNGKCPIKGESIKDTDSLKPFNEINLNHYNIALVAKENNLIILDIDVKDDGLTEWQEYTAKHCEPFTVCEQTPSGGLHYYFIHNDPTYTEEENNLISQLKQKNKYRGKGIDLKINSGYAVCEPSIFDNKPYKFIRHYNSYKFLKMPLPLLKWLLEFDMTAKDAINNNVCIVKSSVDVEALINQFKNVSSQEWLNITTATKNLIHEYNNLDVSEIKTIWDKWSKTETGYNKINNYKIWDSITANINFNYIFYQKYKHEPDNLEPHLLKSVKPYTELYNKPNIKAIEMNNAYIYDENYTKEQLTPEIFKTYDTLIIKSTTGTGKTSNTAKHIKMYDPEGNYKILSIINRVSLVSQHQTNFNNVSINMRSYSDETTNFEDDNIIICINSILKYASYEPTFFKNYIVYIDEITSLLKSLTHNYTINDKLKPVYITLMKIINNCHKLILSDATINDNVFNIISLRPDDMKIFITNTYQKYKNIKVYHMNSEIDFLNKMNDNIINNNYFLFGCDSQETTIHYRNEAIKTTAIENTILKTSKNNFIITDANEQFKNKFVFYSPSITTGIDISYTIAQDVFIYIKGHTLSPVDSFQQLTRTRNIKNVYFYIKDKKSTTAEYNTLEATVEHYKNVASVYSNVSDGVIKEMCFNVIDNEYVFNENSFFKLFVYNEYINDIHDTNKEAHFKQILKKNGFKIKEVGKKEKLNKKKIKEMKEIEENNKEIIFNDHINDVNKNEGLTNIFNFLSVIDKPTAERYKEILKDEHKRNDYLNLIKLLRPQDIINKRLIKDKNSLTAYKAIYTNYYKVSLMWELETEMNINRFNFQKLDEDKPLTIKDDLIKRINIAFRTDRNKTKTPATFNEYIEYYVGKITNILGELKIIESKRKQINKIKSMHYQIDNVKLNEYLTLYELSDPCREYIFKCEYFNELKPLTEAITDINFIDEIEYILPDADGLDFGL